MVAQRTDVLHGLPKTLKIGHLKYSVKIVPEGSLEGCYGDTCSIKQVIRIERGMSSDRAREVVLHEILHAIWGSRDIGDRSAEEKAVTNLAAGLVSAMALNARLRKWIARELCNVQG